MTYSEGSDGIGDIVLHYPARGEPSPAVPAVANRAPQLQLPSFATTSHSLFAPITRVDTGSTLGNYAFGAFLTVRNLVAAAENTPFEIIGGIDDVGNKVDAPTWQAATAMAPYLETDQAVAGIARGVDEIGGVFRGEGTFGRLSFDTQGGMSNGVFVPSGAGTTADTVTLYHGHQEPLIGGAFDISSATSLQRAGTPTPGVYLTDDLVRAATQYAGPGGHVTRTQVPVWAAEAMKQASPIRGPGGTVQYEWLARTSEEVKLLNGSLQTLPQMQALKVWLGVP